MQNEKDETSSSYLHMWQGIQHAIHKRRADGSNSSRLEIMTLYVCVCVCGLGGGGYSSFFQSLMGKCYPTGARCISWVGTEMNVESETGESRGLVVNTPRGGRRTLNLHENAQQSHHFSKISLVSFVKWGTSTQPTTWTSPSLLPAYCSSTTCALSLLQTEK